jgi:Mn-dependent DtxR family transcriptional regulator
MGIPVKVMHYYLMLLLSISVVAAMQTVGVILVVAMLITPASTALLLANRLPKVLVIAGIIGFLSSLSGLGFSIIYEMPPGPSIAVTATCIYLLAAFFSPGHGLLAKWFTRRKQQQKIKTEDILKEAFKISLGNPFPIASLKEKLDMPSHQLRRGMQSLSHRKLIRSADSLSYQLTDTGKEQANNLIRAHRLWESYLVNEMGMDTDQIHEEAERFEHILTSAQLDEVDKQLGYPALDPHGSPIPSKESSPNLALNQMLKHESGIISQRQPGTEITYKLWDLGLGPGDHFAVEETGKDIVLRVKQTAIAVPAALASRISVEKI